MRLLTPHKNYFHFTWTNHHHLLHASLSGAFSCPDRDILDRDLLGCMSSKSSQTLFCLWFVSICGAGIQLVSSNPLKAENHSTSGICCICRCEQAQSRPRSDHVPKRIVSDDSNGFSSSPTGNSRYSTSEVDYYPASSPTSPTIVSPTKGLKTVFIQPNMQPEVTALA